MNLFNKDQKPRDETGKEVATVSGVLAKAIDEYIKPSEEITALMVACPKCGGIHFRHCAYIETVTPFIDGNNGQAEAMSSSHPVKVCVKCKTALVSIGKNMYDITDKIDMNAWTKTEVEAHKTTGPGGMC